ncbi:uncharacterized protein [Rutidosis leptorrhynchoides]|uniref:uncharacterized protein n=1 Tax=Rutidosis leptorrhynchoides TaxID=125765 RepID=UPI003A997EAC
MWLWTLASNGIFTTKKLSNIIGNCLGTNNRSCDATIRNNLMPLKVEIFIWRVLRGRIQVRTKLEKIGMDLDSIRCPLRDDDIETINHSMISCRHSMELWEKVYKWWNLGPVSNLSINEAFRGNCNRSLSPLG